MSDILRSEKAFTLVEVVVVLSIISITTVVLLVSLSDQRNTRYVERASREVAAALREAQGYALSGSMGGVGQTVCNHRVFMPTGNTYRVASIYPRFVCSLESYISSYELKAGVTFPSDQGIYFTLPHAKPYYYSAGWAEIVAPQTIAVSRSGLTYYICVYSTGRIVENGASNTCP